MRIPQQYLLIFTLLGAWLCPDVSYADNADEPPRSDDGGVGALIVYTTTTTTGLGSTAGTVLALLSTVRGAAPTPTERKAALRLYLRDVHHELDAAVAVGGGELVEGLGAIMGWSLKDCVVLGRKLRAERADVVLLAARAVDEDGALDALFELLTPEAR